MEMTTAELLRAARQARGITQAELARLTGLARSHVCNLERNANTPTLDTAVRLARALGLCLDDLVPDPPRKTDNLDLTLEAERQHQVKLHRAKQRLDQATAALASLRRRSCP